jgi:hypothetical protein
LADNSEIDKNRALIDDLRANLRKKTLASLNRIAQKSPGNLQVKIIKPSNLTSALNSDRTLVYSQSEMQSLRYNFMPTPGIPS